MKKKPKVANTVLNSYKMQSKEILRHRNEFYSLWRRSDDKTTTWLKRVQDCIRRCEFPTSVCKLLLIDRFVCGLNVNELASFKRAKKSWTLEHLSKHFSKETNDTAYIVITINEGVYQIENITLDVVKPEPNEDECSQRDPLNEMKEGKNSFIDKNPTVDVIEEEVEETIEDDISSDDEQLNFQQALDEEIDHEMLDNGMEFECEDYKFSVKGIANARAIESPDSSAVATDTVVNKVDKNLSSSSVERESVKNDKQKHHLKIAVVCDCIRAAAPAIIIAPEPPDILITPSADVTINDVDRNQSDSSTKEQPIENDQQNHHLNIAETSADTNTSIVVRDPPTSTIKPAVPEVIIDGVNESFTEKESNQNDNHKGNTGTSTVITAPICPAPTVPTGSIIDDGDENLSDSSVEEQSFETDKQRYHKNITRERKRRYACKQCDRTYSRPSKVLFHIRTVHDGIRDHACKLCDRRCTTKQELRIHNRSHTGEKPFTCDECGVSYGYRSALAHHKRSKHQGIRPHKCHICEKSFTMKGLLAKHLVIHTGEKPFVCDQCGKTFNSSSLLKTHKQRTHQQVQPHVCPTCDRRFFAAVELRRHLISHTGVRPYACDQCDKSFAQTGALKTHKNTVHQEIRPHACSHCDKRFKTPTHLNQHLTIHTGVKRYVCDQCDKSFALGHHLSSHKKSVHQKKD